MRTLDFGQFDFGQLAKVEIGRSPKSSWPVCFVCSLVCLVTCLFLFLSVLGAGFMRGCWFHVWVLVSCVGAGFTDPLHRTPLRQTPPLDTSRRTTLSPSRPIFTFFFLSLWGSLRGILAGCKAEVHPKSAFRLPGSFCLVWFTCGCWFHVWVLVSRVGAGFTCGCWFHVWVLVSRLGGAPDPPSAPSAGPPFAGPPSAEHQLQDRLFHLPRHFHFFFLSLGVFSWNFGGG